MNIPEPTVMLSWRKSSYSDTGGQCIEVAPAGTRRLVRDSKNPAGAHLAFDATAWAAFLQGIKNTAQHTPTPTVV
jgi:hypothetical protein